MNIQRATDELHVMFAKLNKAKYNGTLPEPAITIQAQGKRAAYGWCSTGERWTDKTGENKRHEINICAEHLARTVPEICGTMLHEMVHLDNTLKGIQDCSRGGTWHNKKFKKTAEAVGFEVEHSSKYGDAHTKPLPELLKLFESLGIDPEAFSLYRQGEGSAKKKQAKRLTYVCPECAAKVTASKPVNLLCDDCNVKMELKGGKDED
jgi:DNA-directed RNA polymerase subunit RPC12/RpoP